MVNCQLPKLQEYFSEFQMGIDPPTPPPLEVNLICICHRIIFSVLIFHCHCNLHGTKLMVLRNLIAFLFFLMGLKMLPYPFQISKPGGNQRIHFLVFDINETKFFSQISTGFFPASPKTTKKGIAVWIIVVSAIAGVVLLVILIVVFKMVCHFFFFLCFIRHRS